MAEQAYPKILKGIRPTFTGAKPTPKSAVLMAADIFLYDVDLAKTAENPSHLNFLGKRRYTRSKGEPMFACYLSLLKNA
ncbi:24461_t:CDS:2, partial [Gigaspora rosea]